MADYRNPTQYKDAGVIPVENTPNEILGLVEEMHGRVFGSILLTESDKQLKVLYSTLLTKKNYGYGAGGSIGQAFVKKYRHLFL